MHDPTSIDETRFPKVAGLLRDHPVEPVDWGPIREYQGQSCPQKVANTFLLCCLLDYRMKAGKAWENGERLVCALGDPEDIWAKIASHIKEEWESKWKLKCKSGGEDVEFYTHRYQRGHNRLWRIANEICSYFDGDARRIWQDSSAFDVLCRLNYIGAGEQISRMIVRALRDVGQIEGPARGDVKADVHVCRVMGRLFFGEQTGPEATTGLARKLNPNDPSAFDFSLFTLGSTLCRATTPHCSPCYLKDECVYAQGQGAVT